tara:strand:+ start:49 stop:777 length:729 start_codon:yes stop_codon:yes gene_type:complete
MTIEEKKKLVDSYDKWWHTIDFGDGIKSKGMKVDCDEEMKVWKLDDPARFKGKSVLDIGAWDGYHSFFAEKAGASSVTALDKNTWIGESWASKRGFDIAKEVLGSKVKDVTMDIMDATPEKLGKFDVILFAGVLYHLRNPFKALEIVKSLLNEGGSLFIETTISQTHIENGLKEVPIMQFHPKSTLNNDKTNFWSVNLPCLIFMLGEDDNFQIDDIFYTHPQFQRACLYGHYPSERIESKIP